MNLTPVAVKTSGFAAFKIVSSFVELRGTFALAYQ